VDKAFIGHTGQLATCPYSISKQQSLNKGSVEKVMYNDESLSKLFPTHSLAKECTY